MSVVMRAVVACVVFVASYFITYWIPFSLIPAPRVVANVLSLSVGLGAAWFVFTRSGTAPHGLLASMAYGAAVIGAISFSAGFFGPMVFSPDSNQGPLLGLLFTGPLGILVGAAVGGIAWVRRRQTPPLA